MKGMTYIMTYMTEVIGEQGDRSVEEFNAEMNQVIEDLMERYDDEIEILYK